MQAPAPHFLLFSESERKNQQGQWRFLLQTLDGSEQFEAQDAEPDLRGERLELLAVIRGLEALPQPARVTLVTPSKYVNRGLAYGLPEWRANGWQWEHFGEMVPIKNRDLWQRIDRALQYHEIECRSWHFEPPRASLDDPQSQDAGLQGPHFLTQNRRRSLRNTLRRKLLEFRRWVAEAIENSWLWGAQMGTRLLPLPWLD